MKNQKSGTTVELEKLIEGLSSDQRKQCDTVRHMILDLLSLVDAKIGGLALAITGSQIADNQEE